MTEVTSEDIKALTAAIQELTAVMTETKDRLSTDNEVSYHDEFGDSTPLPKIPGWNNLETRIKNALHNKGIKDLGGLRNYTGDLRRVPNLSKKSVVTLRELLYGAEIDTDYFTCLQT